MSSTAPGSGNSSRYLDFDEYVDLKLQKTGSTIKMTDILVALAGVATMFLAYLLTFVVFDQWIVPGGFSIGFRWALLSTLLVLTAAWLAWSVGIPYLRTVNRLFAAREIEKADPDLKSNLLNLIDLRSSGRAIEPGILRALEKNAAVGLQKIDVAQAIDHRPLMRMSYVLLAVVVLFCVYALFSPKKISNSIWRSLLPAAEVNVATQTEIVSVQPGDQTILARETVLVSADIAGDVPEQVWLHYTTSDGKFRDEPIELRTDTDAPTRFRGSLPTVMQDLTYVVRAGDAVSPEYRITVNQPPSATVDKVHYEFPAYMKLEATEHAGGQIDAWEGTKVSLTAHTNMPVKSAKVEFLDTLEAGPNGEVEALFVSGDGQLLTGSWKLGFRSDGAYARHYQIHCTTESGATDPKPIQFSLTIRPDQPPEVALLEPVRDLEAPANAVIPLLIQARDPDFELSHINLHIKKNGQPVHKEPLSDGRQQRLMLKHDLKLERLRVEPGDLIEFWVQAFDNKQPRPNSKVTPELKVRIVDRVTEKEAQQKLAEDKANRDERLKEAEQEQNPDAQADRQPPADDGGADDRRERRDPNAGEDPMPQTPRDAGEDPDDRNKEGAAGQNGDPKNAGGKGQDKNGAQEQRQSAGGEGDQSRDQPLSTDGEDDQKALERLINEFNKKKNSQQSDPKSADANDKQDGAGTEPNPKNSPDSPSDPMNDQKPPGKNETRQPMPADKGNTDKENRDQGTPKPDSQKQEPGKTPQPGSSSPDPANGDSPMDKGKKPEPGAGANQKNPDSATPDSGMPDPKMPGKAMPDADMPDKGAKPEGPDKGTTPGEKPTPEPDGANEGAGAKPDKKPGPGGANEASNEKGPDGADKSPMPDQAAGDGTSTKPKSPMNNAGGQEKKGDMPADGPQEQTADSPDAVQKKADGTETGTAKPDRDPDSKATPSDNPDLKRDPNEKPETRPGNQKSQPPAQPATSGSDNDVKDPGSPQEGSEKPKIDQTQDPAKSPPGKNKQTRQGDPNAANEPKKGDGEKEQRSKSGSGGEGGTSKEDKEGDPGSKSPGEGDATPRPGSQQPGDKKSEKPGDQNRPGTGEKSENGGEKKAGSEGTPKDPQGSESQDPGSKEPKPDGSKPGEAGQKPGAEDDQKGGDQKGGDQKGGEGGNAGEGAGKGPAGKGSPSGGKPGSGRSAKQGNAPGVGQPEGDQPPGDGDAEGTGAPEGEEANLEYKKQATELVLKRLQEGLERGDIDPDLLEKLGWTQDEMQRFTDRMSKHLQESKSGDETPESMARRQQFEEMLKNLDVNKKGTTRSGEKAPQRDVDQIDARRSTVPKEYRPAFEKFSREVTRQKAKPGSPPR
jgi:hypothetical protein